MEFAFAALGIKSEYLIFTVMQAVSFFLTPQILRSFSVMPANNAFKALHQLSLSKVCSVDIDFCSE